MGNKDSHYKCLIDGKESLTLNANLVKSIVELTDDDIELANLEKYQIVRILTNIRQYHFLSSLYERAIRLAGDNKFYWNQLFLSLICEHHYLRASKILQICPNQFESDFQKKNENLIIEYMQLARIQIEQLGDIDLAESAALKAISFSSGTWISGRCNLLLALTYGLKALYSTNFDAKKSLIAESIKILEHVIELDPHDDLAHLYCALEYANFRNLDMARERCQTALNLNMENPFSIMLMALIFTARNDYKNALELVMNALIDFPTNYGLLVLRLKLEAKYGRVEEALQTSRNLIYFWRKIRFSDIVNLDEENTILVNDESGMRLVEPVSGSTKQHLGSKEAIVPLTPLLTAPLGISATSTHLSILNPLNTETGYPSTDNLSTIMPTAGTSEFGGPGSTDSISILSSSSKSWISFSAFRMQADIWVELAEFFIEIDRLSDVQACVEEACTIYYNSHQALYLKGYLYMVRANKLTKKDPSLSKRLKMEAKNYLLGAISMCTGHVSSYIALGKLYYLDGNLKMAEKMFRDSIVIDPFNFESWHRLGCVLAELGRSDEAMGYFQTAESLNINTPLIPFQVIPRLLSL